MNIGVNVSALSGPYTGISKYITSVYSELVAFDTENKYFFFSHAPIVSEQVPKSIREKILLFKSPIYLPKSVTKVYFDLIGIRGMLQNKQIDLYHSPAYSLPLGPKKGIKYVVTIHDLIAFQSIKLSGFFIAIYLRIVITFSIILADKIITDSKSVENDLKRLFPQRTKVETIYLGITTLFLKGVPNMIDKENRGTYILAICTHPYRKNITNIIYAIAQSDYILSTQKLIIVGILPEYQKEEIINQAKKCGFSGKVTILSGISDVELLDIYMNASFLLYPSYYEGFGLPIVEAMACGCPVITSNCSSMPELMPDSSWLVDPYSVISIRKKAEQMLAQNPNQRRTIIDSNRVWATKFTWKRTSELMLRIFNQYAK